MRRFCARWRLGILLFGSAAAAGCSREPLDGPGEMSVPVDLARPVDAPIDAATDLGCPPLLSPCSTTDPCCPGMTCRSAGPSPIDCADGETGCFCSAFL